MQMTATSAPTAGFADPVQQSQTAFRALLDAMARPGRMTLIDSAVGHPDGVVPALAAAALTLCDLDTPVWLGPGLDTEAMRGWLRFHTGAPLVSAPEKADFALLDAAAGLPALGMFHHGSDAAPEGGATLLVQTGALDGAAAMTWRGPGIRDASTMPLCGLPEDFWHSRAALSAAFPRGIDLYLCAGSALIGLPRSTAISFTAEA